MGDICRAHAADFLVACGPLPPEKRYVLECLMNCRTARLGGHRWQCDRCGKAEQSYNSCRNRHCPKCQAGKQAEWLAARQEDLLPVEYFHVVFTLPESLARIALQNPRVVYKILFEAAAETLLEVANDKRHLGAKIGILAVLHTWGQNLHHHPHVHCVVPGGGLSADESRWIASRSGFLLPVRVLSIVYRAKFLKKLKEARARGDLQFHGSLVALRRDADFNRLVRDAYSIDWVVYAKPPFGGPKQVLKYLARYTHRIAVSNRRLCSLENGRVKFRWKNYAQGQQYQTMTLSAVEFIRRLMLHVLPKRFVRIRHFGLLANCHRRRKIAHCRSLLVASPAAKQPTEPDGSTEVSESTTGEDVSRRCGDCDEGRMLLVEEIPPLRSFGFDTS